ncbi:breast carcinoma-amplified sequence 1 isoform X3 [Pseudophryne corroboree]|uniref:breast carcinoma-amplified sequence 1 isoform X3 n=1 Tax=Pseudophryne corroboree TaxID=495146 RepID=UPI003081ED47
MGNEVSSSDVEEDQDGHIKENAVFAAEVKNGPITLQSSPIEVTSGTNDVSAKQTIQQEKVITSSQKTIVISPFSNGAVTNIQTNPPPPAAKSKFSLAILRPSPGQTAFLSNGLDVGSVKPELTLIQDQTGTANTPQVAVTQENISGVQNPASSSSLITEEVSLSPTNTIEVESAPPKPKEVSIFQRIFKPDKKIEIEAPLQVEVPESQDVMITMDQNAGLQSAQQISIPQTQNIDDNKQAAVQEQSLESASVSASPETISAAIQTPAPEIHPVMSFFKTLVTPNKSVSKSEEEVTGEADDKKKENGRLRKSSSKKEKTKSTVQQTAETSDKGLRKSESPKSRTLSRLFRQKTKKEEQQPSSSNVVTLQSVVSVNSDNSDPEQVLIQDPISPDVPSQIAASEDDRKADKAPATRPKPFWRKSFKADPQPIKIQENVSSFVAVEQPVVSVSLNSEQSAPEQVLIQDTTVSDSDVPAQDNGKPVIEVTTRPVPFWKKSFKGEQQLRKPQENVAVEQPVVSVSLNSEQSVPEQVLIQDTTPSDSDVPPQDNGKPVIEVTTRPVPFWKKSFKGEQQFRKPQENVAVQQPVVSVSLNSEQSVPEQVLIQDTTPSDSDVPPQDNGKPVIEVTTRPVPFWKKSFKGEQQLRKPQENVAVEQPVVSLSLNSEQSAPEQVLIQDTTPSDSDVPQQDNGKLVQEVSPWPVPFWRKSSKAEPQLIKIQENASADPGPHSSKGDSASTGNKSQESSGKKTEDGKNSKPKLMMFFKQLSVIGDGSNPSSEAVNEKSTNSPTLDITDGVEVSKGEKTVVTAVVEPPPQKGKENLKEKKASAEKLNKQESRESPETAGSIHFQAPDAVFVQNGGESSKDGQLKKVEKRQSLGSFFKAIGPKRMCDAEVQTDPVSVYPAEKAK